MLTVTQLTAHIKDLLEDDRTLRDLSVEGEISNFKRAPSGHCYFTLKDAKASIACVMWSSHAQWLPRLPADGEFVLAQGYVSLYEAQGRVQFYAHRIESAGVGRLYQELEALKQRLEAEGLFDPERKRPLPRWPRRIGVITSPQAAALQDILRTLANLYPLADVLLAPTSVQGAEAPAQIAAAIELLNHWHLVEPVDVIVVARGGGSIEELWAFNDERVVRAIAASNLPVISGVGHETDVTLADFAADWRAATPTAAAAAAVPDGTELASQVESLVARAGSALTGRVAAERQALGRLQRALQRASPQKQVADRRQQVDELSLAAARALAHRFDLRRARLDGLEARLASLDPKAVLARGYSITQDAATGGLVTSVDQVAGGQRLRTLVADGEFDSVVMTDADS